MGIMFFYRALVGCRVIEATENYSIADLPLKTRLETERNGYLEFYDDEEIWKKLFRGSEGIWGYKVDFYKARFRQALCQK